MKYRVDTLQFFKKVTLSILHYAIKLIIFSHFNQLLLILFLTNISPPPH